jgi:hypothetical protein
MSLKRKHLLVRSGEGSSFFIKRIDYYHEDTNYTLQQQDVKIMKNARNQEKNKKVKNRKQKLPSW